MSPDSKQPTPPDPPPVPSDEILTPILDDEATPPDPPAASEVPDPVAPPPPPPGSGFADRVKPILKPLWDNFWLNMQVWIPFLANPQLRARQIKYRARENRDGLEWTVKLPKQCWQCGSKIGLKNRTYDKDVRTFEFAASILGVTLGVFLILMLIAVSFVSFGFLLAAPMSLVVGGGILFIKSWIERVELTMSTCEAHSDAMRCPELVIEDETLYVHAPNPGLADAAIEALRAERSKGPRYVPPETSSKGPRPSESVPMDSPASPTPAASKGGGYAREELPPIKLDAPPELVDPMMQADPTEVEHKIHFDEPIKFGESIKLDDKIQLEDDQPPKS